MGKKARLKAIKRLADELPVINMRATEKQLNGNNVVNRDVLVPRNHQRRIKRAYLKRGVEGVTEYFQEVTNIIKKATDERRKEDQPGQA